MNSNETAVGQPRLVMLVAHEPDRDPRIEWVARTAAETHDTIVLGFFDPRYEKPAEEARSRYRIRRFKPEWNRGEAIGLGRAVFRRLVPWWLKCALVILAMLAWLPLLVLEIVVRIVRFLWRMLTRLLVIRVTLRLLTRPIPSRFTWSTIDWLRFKWLVRYFIYIAARLDLAIRASDLRPDVVYCNDLDTLLAGVLTKVRTGCTLIYDAHELWPYSDPAATRYHVKAFHWYERWLSPKADHVLSVNPYLCRIMARHYGLKRVLSIPNSTPWLDHIPPFADSARMNLVANGRVRFLFQGGFAAERGLEEVLRAWRHIDPDRAVLLIRGPESQDKQTLQQLAQELQLESVHFLDSVPESELVAAAADADVGLIPYKPGLLNHTYCCPNKLSQYMHAGVAILSNNLPYVKRVIREYGCGLAYDSSDERGMVAVFNQLITDTVARDQMRRNARRFAREQFNWQVQSRPLAELLEGLALNGAAAVRNGSA